MSKKFLVGVADVTGYNGSGLILFKSKAMLNTSIDISTGSTEIAGGKRNKLQNIYYHSGRVNVTLENTEWDMNWVKANTGAYNIDWATPYTESLTLVADANTVTETPVTKDGEDAAYGYIEKNGDFTQVTFTGKTFQLPAGFSAGENVCIEYFINDVNATSYAIPASIIPDRIRLVMNCDIASNTAGDGVIGQAIVEVPALQLSGAQTINMTSDGYSTTPLSGMALAFKPSGIAVTTSACLNKEVYTIITEKLNNVNWYDDVIGLAIIGGDYSAAVGTSKQLQVIAVTSTGTKYAPNSALTFTADPSGDTDITVAATGIISVANSATTGDTNTINVKITAKQTIEANCVVTVA